MANFHNQFSSNNVSVNNILPQFIDRLRQLHGIITQNTYVKDTSKHLERIIGDANNQTMILVVGKERVGKTTLINGLFGRELLPASELNPTAVNTFLRYGEQEQIKAYFLDGVIAIFDISILDLLTTADTFASQILREHLDYLEVYINHDLLKSVTIIDTVALQVGGGEAAYFPESLINRVYENLWVLRCGSVAIDSEVKLMENLHDKGIDPLLVVNAIDVIGTDSEAFVADEKERIGHLTKEVITVSAIKAKEATHTNSEELWQASRYAELINKIERVAQNSEKKTHSILVRFLQWLERFRFDVTIIPQRDPFVSAVENIEKYSGNMTYEFSRRQRDLVIVEEYKNEYEQVSDIFAKVQTLYQLLQLISQYNYLQDEVVDEFSSKAVIYQQTVREYRNMHAEYLREYTRLDAQHNK
ncbi:MAG: dynamin family protein, partial [Lysinibacillus sp.]